MNGYLKQDKCAMAGEQIISMVLAFSICHIGLSDKPSNRMFIMLIYFSNCNAEHTIKITKC